jgi:hypothetical protein
MNIRLWTNPETNCPNWETQTFSSHGNLDYQRLSEETLTLGLIYCTGLDVLHYASFSEHRYFI